MHPAVVGRVGAYTVMQEVLLMRLGRDEEWRRMAILLASIRLTTYLVSRQNGASQFEPDLAPNSEWSFMESKPYLQACLQNIMQYTDGISRWGNLRTNMMKNMVGMVD